MGDEADRTLSGTDIDGNPIRVEEHNFAGPDGRVVYLLNGKPVTAAEAADALDNVVGPVTHVWAVF